MSGLRIQTKATQPLWDLGMNFGVRFAYDSAQCEGPWSCDLNYQRFGYLGAVGSWTRRCRWRSDKRETLTKLAILRIKID